MTTTDMLNRIAAAARAGDQMDLDALVAQIDGLMIADDERAAWLSMIEVAMEAIDGGLA